MNKIARVWFGTVPLARADEYTEYLKKTGVKDLRATKGNEGVLVWKRLDQDTAEFGVISFWRSQEDIQAFAGSDINKAVYYPEDKDFLLKMEPELQHFEVAVSDGVNFSD